MATSASIREGSFTVRSDHYGDLLMLDAVGELDIATAPTLEESLRHALEGQAASIILDVAQVSFIDSSGLRALIHAARRSRENGARLHIRCGSGAVRQMIESTGLDRSLPLVR